MIHPDLKFPREKIEHFCRRHRVRSLALFGSAIREDFGPDSDMDVLVEFENDDSLSLLQLARLEGELEDILGRSVDMLERGKSSGIPITSAAAISCPPWSRSMDRDEAYLLDILLAAEEALAFSRGLSWEQFQASRLQ